MVSESGERPYDGLRIIDLSGPLGAYAGRLFADLGAEVIRVEPPGGRADRRDPPGLPGGAGGIPFQFLNANKKSVAIDLAGPAGRGLLAELVARADVVLLETDVDGGNGAGDTLLPEILAVPGARVVTVVSWFGTTGPYAGYRGSDLVAQALGGLAWLSGEPGRPPLRIAGQQSLFVTSLYAAAATAVARWDCELHGRGHLVDVSAQECIAHSLQNAVQVWDLEGRVSMRGGEGTRDATEAAFRCRDGWVFLAAPLALSASWSALIAWMRDVGFDGAETLAGEPWRDRPARTTAAMKAEFRTLFERFLADRTRAEIAAEALKRKIVLAPVARIADLPADPQLLFRRYFQKLRLSGRDGEVLFPGAPYRLSEPVWRLDRPAPRPGEHDGEILGATAARGDAA